MHSIAVIVDSLNASSQNGSKCLIMVLAISKVERKTTLELDNFIVMT